MAEPLLDNATASAGDDLYHRLFEEMPIPIAVYSLDDPDNTILYVNRYAREVWRRWESGDVVGLPAMQLTPPDERPMIADVFARLRNGDRIEWIEERLVGPHGHEISVLASTTPVTYRGRRAALLAIHDITDLKKAQAEFRRQAEIMATLEERERLARELHDGLG
jgi:PAS domain S-box-containing protein